MAKAAKPGSGGTKTDSNQDAEASADAGTNTETTAKPTAASESKPAASKPTVDSGEAVKITPPEQTQAKPQTSGTWLVVVFFIAVIGTGAYMSEAKWYPRVAPYLAEYLPASLNIDIEDPRVAGLSSRVSGLETKTRDLADKGKTISALEAERAKLKDALDVALKRIAIVEESIGAVRDMVKSTASAEEAAAASKSLGELNARLKNLEAMRQSGVASTAVADDIAARVVKLEQNIPQAGNLAARVAKLENTGSQLQKADEVQRNSGEKLAGSLAGVEERLAQVEKRSVAASASASSGSATVLMVAQLRDGVRSGAPFEKILAGLDGLAGNDPGMKAPLLMLGKHAKTGIPTLTTLRDEFASLASSIAAAANNRSGDSWFDKAVNKVSSLVTLRRIDGVGETVEAMVARAEARLKAGDLISAAKAVGGIEARSKAAHQVAAPWLSRAKARLAAERALASLHVHAVSLLSPAKE